MKLPISLFFIILTILAFSDIANGQNDSVLTEDQKKIELMEKLADLKRQEIQELERQIALKEREVQALKDANNRAESQSTANPPQSSQVNGSFPAEIPVQTNGPKVSEAKESFVSESKPTTQPAANVKPPTAEAKNQRVEILNCETDSTRKTRLEKQVCQMAEDAVRQFNASDNADNHNSFELDIKNASQTAPIIIGTLIKSNKFTDPLLKKFLVEAEDSRLDKQIGADSKSSGTTSLVVKGGVPAFLNWAVENGAASNSISGTTTTFRINPIGFLETVTGAAPVTGESPYKNKPFQRELKKTSIGLTFDLSRGSSPNVFTGDKQQLSAVSFRYEFINQRNNYKEKLPELLNDEFVVNYAFNQAETFKSIFTESDANGVLKFKNSAAQVWLDALQQKVKDLGTAKFKSENSLQKQFEEVEKLINTELNSFPSEKVANDKPFFEGLLVYVQNARDYVKDTDDFVKAARRGHVFSFEYTNNREINASDTSNLRLIYEKNTFFGTDFTVNGSLTFYHRKPMETDAKKLKDFNLSAQLDVPLTGLEGLRKGVLSFAGKYQRVNGDAIALDGTVIPNTKGDIAVGQVKLILPITKGIKLPISATFANRTELIREKEVRGNFGITFDIDTLFTRLLNQ